MGLLWETKEGGIWFTQFAWEPISRNLARLSLFPFVITRVCLTEWKVGAKMNDSYRGPNIWSMTLTMEYLRWVK